MENKLDLFGADTASRGIGFEQLRIAMPSLWQWVKAGFGLTVGFGLAWATLAIPFFLLWLLFAGLMLRGLVR